MTRFRYALVLYTYNQSATVRCAAQTVLAQECDPIEILFSDDCSKDDTFEILQDLAKGYRGPHRIRLNRNPQNLGVIEHVHRIYTLTDADVIINCAGDDLSRPDRAALIIDAFEREQPLLACSHAKVQYADGTEAPRVYEKANFYYSTDALVAADSMQLYLGATSAWHRDIHLLFGPVQFHDCFEDLVYGFRASLAGRVAVIEDELVTYTLGHGVTNSKRAAEAEDQIRAMRLKELGREISVLSQRRLDAEVFGIHEGHSILRRIDAALRRRRVRHDYVSSGARSLWQTLPTAPLETLRAALSENRKWRKARRGR